MRLPGFILAALVAAPTPGPRIGAPLPAVSLPDLQGRPLALGEVKDPVLVLNLWAFWCDTWKAELPQLRELATQQKTLGFKLLCVSVDGAGTDIFRSKCPQGVPFGVLLDHRGLLTRALGVRKVPTVLVFDRKRRLRYVHAAYPGNPSVLQAIRQAAGAKG